MYFLRGEDPYSLKARIQPVLLLVAPMGIVLFVLTAGNSLPVSALLGVVVVVGGVALMSQIARDKGSEKQEKLWASWGGAPTTRLLRYREAPDQEALLRRRTKLEEVTGHKLPTEEEEIADSVATDQRYVEAVTTLRSMTYDSTKFPLVLAENSNYGLRRNLWGIRSEGLWSSGACALLCWGIVGVAVWPLPVGEWSIDPIRHPDAKLVAQSVGAVINTLALGAWIFVVKPGWVKVAAERYAQQLFGTLDNPELAPRRTDTNLAGS